MGLWDFVKSEARQMAIARPDNMKHLIVYKHPDETIAKWAQLTVDSDEGAVFFKEGKVAGVLGAGRHTLDAATYPFLTGLVDKYAGGDIFKSEVFFVRTQPLRNDPIMFGGQVQVTDGATEMPARTQIHGKAAIQVTDPVKFIIGLTGQSIQPQDNQQILQYARDKFMSGLRGPMARFLKDNQVCVVEIDTHYDDIKEMLVKGVPDLEVVGLKMVEIIDFVLKVNPEDREPIMEIWKEIRVDTIRKQAELKRRKMEIEVDLMERQQYVNMAQNPAYMNYAQAEAMLGAGEGMAKGGGDASLAGMGAQMAVGMAMAGGMNQGFQAPQYQRVAPPQGGGGVACGSCGFQNPGGKFCSGCGQPLAPPQPAGGGFCANCGNQLAPGAKFCANCGTQSPGGGPAAGQGGPPQGGGYPQAPQGAQPQQGYPQAPQGGQPQQGYPQAPQGGQPQPGGQYAPAPPGGHPPGGGGHGPQGGQQG